MPDEYLSVVLDGYFWRFSSFCDIFSCKRHNTTECLKLDFLHNINRCLVVIPLPKCKSQRKKKKRWCNSTLAPVKNTQIQLNYKSLENHSMHTPGRGFSLMFQTVESCALVYLWLQGPSGRFLAMLFLVPPGRAMETRALCQWTPGSQVMRRKGPGLYLWSWHKEVD